MALQPIKSMFKRAAYGMLELCSGGRGIRRTIGGQAIRFPAQWCRYYPGSYEPNTFDMLREHCRSGDVVLDIGAHLGLFSVVMSRLVGAAGHVYSFEPTSLSYTVLNKVVLLNECQHNVTIHAEAVAGVSGEMAFYDTGHLASNANSLIATARAKGQSRIRTVALDDFVAERKLDVRFLKIDVEGAEFDLVSGARQLFLTSRPVASLSVHPEFLDNAGHKLDKLWGLLSSLGMSVCSPEGSRDGAGQILLDRNAFCQATCGAPFDVKLMPEELASRGS